VENNFLLSLLAPPPPVAGQTTPQTEANAAMAQKLDSAVKEFGRDIVKQCLSGGDCPVAAQVAIAALRAMMTQGDNGPSHAGNNDGQIDAGPNHTGNNAGQVDVGPNHTGNNQTSGQGATNTGNTSGAPDTGGNTTGTPIPDGPNKDDLAYLALKGKEAQEAAGKLGFDRRISVPKAPFNSHWQPVFFDGKTYIMPDVDSHNVTNGWKMFDRKGKRMGTYDSDLKRIKG